MAERKDDLKEGDSGFTNLCLNRQYSVMLTGITMKVMIVGTKIDAFVVKALGQSLQEQSSTVGL